MAYRIISIVVTVLALASMLSCNSSNSKPTGDTSVDPLVYAALADRDSSQNGGYRIAHTSDIHHYAPSLYNPESASFETFAERNEGRSVLYTTDLIRALGENLVAEEIDSLFISGDLSILGTETTHRDTARLLSDIEESGIDVYVVPGNHDVSNPNAFRVIDVNGDSMKWTESETFRSIYADFGFTEAVMVHDESLSYMAYLNDGYALLALDTAFYQNNGFLGYAAPTGIVIDSLYPWTKAALERARSDGRRVIVMSHHNFMNHYEVDFELTDFVVQDNGQMRSLLTSGGVEIALSGHIHKSDIKTVSVDGHPFTGVSTAALPLYPHSYRILGLGDGEVGITTKELILPYDDNRNTQILSYNREIGRKRFFRDWMSVAADLSERDARILSDHLYITNLYAQQGLEAYLPDRILESRGARLVRKSDSDMMRFMVILPVDSPPDDRDTVIRLH